MRFPLLAATLAVSFVFAALIGLFFLLHGAGRVPPLDVLPAETRFFVSVPAPRALADSMARARPIRDGLEPGDELHIAAAMLSEEISSRGFTGMITPDEATSLLESEMVLAQIGARTGDRSALVLVARPPGGPRRAIDALLRRASERIPGYSESWTRARQHHGMHYRTVRPPGPTGPLCVAAFKDLLLVSTTGASMRRLLDTASGRGRPVRSSPACRAALDRVSPGADLLAYASGDWIRDRLPAPDPAGSGWPAADLIGAGAVQGAGLGVRVVRDLFQERLFVSRPVEGRGAGEALIGSKTHAWTAGGPVWDRFEIYATLSMTDHRVGAAEGLTALISGLSGEAPDRVRRRLEGLEEFLSIDFTREIAAAFGNVVAIGVAPAGGSGSTSALASVAVRDAEAAARLLRRADGLATALEAQRSSRVRGESITFYESSWLAPVRPAHRLSRGRLWAATSPDLLVEQVEIGARPPGAGRSPGPDRVLDLVPREAHLFVRVESGPLLDWTGAAGPRSHTGIGAGGFRSAAAGDEPEAVEPLPTILAARFGDAGILIDCAGPVSPALLALRGLRAGGFRYLPKGDGTAAREEGPGRSHEAPIPD